MYKILPYYGFGNNDQVTFSGRVVIDNNYETYRNKSGLLNSLIGFLKRFNVRPVQNLEVSISFENNIQTVKTNEYGIFSTSFNPSDLEDDKWLVAQASINLPDNKVVIANLNSLNDVIGNEYGIISDIDDTILISRATKKLQLIYLTVFKKPSERQAFEGVVDLYGRLVKGSAGKSTNPIFYISSSHWNLFDLLNDFMEANKFPKGPLLLKRVKGLRDMIATIGNHDHKKTKIIEVIKTFPTLKFVLIGDSGQRDAAIYASIANEYPNNVKAILLRDVTSYDDPIVKASKEITPHHIPFKVFSTAAESIDYAREISLIP